MAIWSQPAKADLRSIHDFIAHDSSFYAKKVAQDIREKTDILEQLSQAGRKVVELNEEQVRELSLYSFRIILASNAPHGVNSMIDYRDRITIEPGKRGGKPCIRRMRITVYDVLDWLASGMSEVEILEDYPELTQDDIRACLAFAANREHQLSTIAPA